MTGYNKLVIFIVGPANTGKTTISNFIEKADRVHTVYHPTQGVR
jgi:polynucleotide 5'-kinase involved in rRNA processing